MDRSFKAQPGVIVAQVNPVTLTKPANGEYNFTFTTKRADKFTGMVSRIFLYWDVVGREENKLII